METECPFQEEADSGQVEQSLVTALERTEQRGWHKYRFGLTRTVLYVRGCSSVLM